MNMIKTARALLDLRFLRFLLVGGLNTIFGYVVYLICLYVGMGVEIALAVTTCIGATFNYFTNSILVFRHRGRNLLPRFLAAYGVVYVVNVVTIRILLATGLGPAIAQAILLPGLAALAYLIFKFFVFKANDGDSGRI